MIQHIHHLPGRTIQAEGNEFLYFSGTSYLGIARNKDFQKLLLEGFVRYGTNYSSSRISNIQLTIFDEAEQYLATYLGMESALTFSSGFLAGQATAKLLQSEGEFLYAPRTHPALWLSQSESSISASYPQWTRDVLRYIKRAKSSRFILLVNSLDPLLVEHYDFSWVQHLPHDKEFILVIDDSHGLGVTEANGEGIAKQIPAVSHVEVIIVSSLGKALGLPGGIVAGNAKRLSQLKTSPFFTAGSPMPPAYLYAFLQADTIYTELRKKLIENTLFFQQQTESLNLFRSIPNYPVFYTFRNELYPFLYKRNILISSFPYPSPHDPSITRIIINALHTKDDISQVTREIADF